MGHFSYSCQLSGLPITSGTKCAIVPMLPRGNFHDNGEAYFRKFGKSNFCSNEGVNVFFNESLFPIFGEYNEYGGIENIIKDDNVKCLEEYYELSIEDICTVLCDDRKEEFNEGGDFCESVGILKKKNPKHMQLLRMSIVWLHADFYNKLSKEKTGNNFWDKLDIGVPSLLKKLGFKFVEKTKKDRYNQLFEKGGLQIYSDGNWISVQTTNSIYSLSDLKKYCEKKGVHVEIEPLNSMSYCEQIYECIIPELETFHDGEGRWESERVINLLLGDKHKIGNKTTESGLKAFMVKLAIKSIEKGVEDSQIKADKSLEELKEDLKLLNKQALKEEKEIPAESITEFYFKKIKEEGGDFLRSNIADWHKVKGFYYSMGKYLYPIGTSPQDGDLKGVKAVLESALAVINKEIDEYYGEDEDEEE